TGKKGASVRNNLYETRRRGSSKVSRVHTKFQLRVCTSVRGNGLHRRKALSRLRAHGERNGGRCPSSSVRDCPLRRLLRGYRSHGRVLGGDFAGLRQLSKSLLG